LPLLTACCAYKKGKVWTALHRRIIDRLHRQTRQKIREIELSVEHETLAEVWRASMGNTGRAALAGAIDQMPPDARRYQNAKLSAMSLKQASTSRQIELHSDPDLIQCDFSKCRWLRAWLLLCRSHLFRRNMLGIPRRFSHFVYGVIQSGLTCAIAAAIASFPFVATGTFTTRWLQSWFVAWIMMLPIVLFAAPAIRNLTHILTRED